MGLNEGNIIKDNVKKLRQLNEYVNRYDIVDAIKNREVVKIYYQGDHENGKTVNRGYRTIEPHVLGRTKSKAEDPSKSTAGNMVVRAWQQAGASDTHNVRPDKSVRIQPKGWWRLFRLDGISQLLPTGANFEFYEEKGDYKPNSDKDIDVLIQVDYNNGVGYNIQGTDSIDEPETFIKRVGDFDPETIKSKEYADDEKNAQEILKQKINGLYDMVKRSHKKSANDYIAVSKNGKIIAIPKYNRYKPKYNDYEFVGNLTDLVRELNADDVEPDKRLPKVLPSMEREQEIFRKNAEARKAERAKNNQNI